MQFFLTRTLLRSLVCADVPQGQEPVDRLNYAPRFAEELSRQFVVSFELEKALNPSGQSGVKTQLRLSYLAFFEAAEDLTEELKSSHFTRVNAPAVGYPYLRAFVSQFASLAGFEPCTLPIKNFMAGNILPPFIPKAVTDGGQKALE